MNSSTFKTASTSKNNSTCCSGLIQRLLSQQTRVELSAVLKLAWPVAALNLFQLLLQFTTVLFCGHLGDEVLAGISLAASYINVTAIALGTGFGTAIDTLASQSWGANNKRRVGIILQQSLLIFTALCFPVWGFWLNTEKISAPIVSNKDSARIAGQFMDIFLPCLPAIFLFIILSKYLENQEIVRPLLITGLISTVLGIVYNAVFVYGFEMGVTGIAIAAVLGNYTLALSTLAVIISLKLHKDTWDGWTRECLLEWGLFCKLAFSGLVMIVFIWGSYQAGTFFVAMLDDADLSAYGIVFQMTCLVVSWPMGLSVAASVRVGIFLGQGKFEQAKFAANLCIHLTWITAFVCGVLIVACRRLIGLAFTSNEQVLDILSKTFVVYFAWIIVFDWMQTVFQGVVRGCGDQKAGAIVSVIAFVIAVPAGGCLLFLTPLGALGYWLGLGISAIFQATAYYALMHRTNWEEQAVLARRRSGVLVEDVRTLIQRHMLLRGVAKSTPEENQAEENQPLVQQEFFQPKYYSENTGVYQPSRPGLQASFSISESQRMPSVEVSMRNLQSSMSRQGSRRLSASISRANSLTMTGTMGSFQDLTVTASMPVFISRKIVITRIIVYLVAIALFIVGLMCRLML